MRLQQYIHWELPDVQAGFRKGRGSEIKLPTSVGWEFQKNIYFCFSDYAKSFDCGITTDCRKFLKRWKYQTTWPPSWEISMQVKKQQLEQDMEQQAGSKLGKEYVKAVYCHSLYSAYIQSESESHSVMSNSLSPHGLYSPWNFPGQNTGVGSLFLLQVIFPTQGLNPGLPHYQWILCQLSHKGSPYAEYRVEYIMWNSLAG